MRNVVIALLFLAATAVAQTPKRAAIHFGKPMPVKWFVGADESHSLDMTVRPLWIAGKLREFTVGEPHEVTDQTFVVRRAYRINDALPEDERKVPNWRWARGGWLLVNRTSGSVSHLRLPLFEPYYSAAAWYRDYIAYCGVSDDAERVYAMVVRIGVKKPVLQRSYGKTLAQEMPDSECERPRWQRGPARVTFNREHTPAMTFAVRGGHAELLTSEPAAEEAAAPSTPRDGAGQAVRDLDKEADDASQSADEDAEPEAEDEPER